MYEGVQLEVLSTTIFDENSDLSLKYLGRIDMTRQVKLSQKKVIYIGTRIYGRKIIRCCRILDTFRNRSKLIIYVQGTLFKM